MDIRPSNVIDDLSEGSISLEKTLELCYAHTGIFGKTFMPESFNAEHSLLHKQIHSAIDSAHRKVCIAAPRGIGKTTTVRAHCMRSILYRTCEFILYVSNSETAAELQTENIKRELRTNPEIRKMFGDIAINESNIDFDETFSKRAWVAFGNTLVLPRGSGQQVRGLIYKRFRPQLIIVDDLEEREELANPEIRRKIKTWFRSDLEKCIDRYKNDWKIIYIDTLKHSDSLMEELLNSPDWFSIRLDLCDDEYNSLVPELFTTEELHREVESHRRDGTMDVFYMEYRNMPVSRENASFEQKYFKYYDETSLDPIVKKRLENVIIVDPAKSVQMQSAESAIVGIGVDYVGGGLYIRDVVHRKMYPDQLYDEMFAMRRRLMAHAIGIEVTGLEEFIKQPILNEMIKRGPHDSFEPIWLKARGGSKDERAKIARIQSLVPYYRSGYIWHNKACCNVLEEQLISFPRGKLVDVADATAYVIEMLEIGERYFNAPPDDLDEIEDEFDDLEYDEPLGDEWRRI